jgi:ZIP family zinc transporter
MSAGNIALLGAIAGFTIFLGLPVGRVNARMVRTKTLLNAVAIGVLVFLLWDVLAHAWEPVDAAVGRHEWGKATIGGVVLALGIGVGLLGLVYFDRWVARRRAAAGAAASAPETAPARESVPAGAAASAGLPASAGRAAPTGQPTAHGEGLSTPVPSVRFWQTPAGELAFLIAVGIGLHNFAEGLAIGNSAASGELSLALLLVIGFAAHNATEGFGIVAPLATAAVRPSWRQLGLLGLIGGGPTLVGTLIGQRFVNDTISIVFLALAAGSILYVVIELLAVARRLAAKEWTSWGLLVGLFAGFATDAILAAAGG